MYPCPFDRPRSPHDLTHEVGEHRKRENYVSLTRVASFASTATVGRASVERVWVHESPVRWDPRTVTRWRGQSRVSEPRDIHGPPKWFWSSLKTHALARSHDIRGCHRNTEVEGRPRRPGDCPDLIFRRRKRPVSSSPPGGRDGASQRHASLAESPYGVEHGHHDDGTHRVCRMIAAATGASDDLVESHDIDADHRHRLR